MGTGVECLAGSEPAVTCGPVKMLKSKEQVHVSKVIPQCEYNGKHTGRTAVWMGPHGMTRLHIPISILE